MTRRDPAWLVQARCGTTGRGAASRGMTPLGVANPARPGWSRHGACGRGTARRVVAGHVSPGLGEASLSKARLGRVLAWFGEAGVRGAACPGSAWLVKSWPGKAWRVPAGQGGVRRGAAPLWLGLVWFGSAWLVTAGLNSASPGSVWPGTSRQVGLGEAPLDPAGPVRVRPGKPRLGAGWSWLGTARRVRSWRGAARHVLVRPGPAGLHEAT